MTNRNQSTLNCPFCGGQNLHSHDLSVSNVVCRCADYGRLLRVVVVLSGVLASTATRAGIQVSTTSPR